MLITQSTAFTPSQSRTTAEDWQGDTNFNFQKHHYYTYLEYGVI